jgi:hypothetical protein
VKEGVKEGMKKDYNMQVKIYYDKNHCVFKHALTVEQINLSYICPSFVLNLSYICPTICFHREENAIIRDTAIIGFRSDDARELWMSQRKEYQCRHLQLYLSA